MENRQRMKQHVVVLPMPGLPKDDSVGRQVAMGQYGTLRSARGAGCVENGCGIVRPRVNNRQHLFDRSPWRRSEFAGNYRARAVEKYGFTGQARVGHQ